MNIKTLTEIGILYNTDKAVFHHFTEIYEEYFKPLRYNTLNILEIGIDNGYSIFMLREYFPNAQIYAIDCLDKTHLQGERFTFSVGDQADRNYMKNIFSNIQFDIIIDDGGHGMEQQQVTLEEALPKLKSGGIYILEDLHTSYEYNYTEDKNNNTTLNLLENIHNYTNNDNNFFINDIQNVQKQIGTCKVFYNNTAGGALHRGKSITSVIIKN